MTFEDGYRAIRERVERHLERAYFDSSDILLTVLLDAFRAFSVLRRVAQSCRLFPPDRHGQTLPGGDGRGACQTL